MQLTCTRCHLINASLRLREQQEQGSESCLIRGTDILRIEVIDVTGVPITSNNMNPYMNMYSTPSTTWLVSQVCSSLRVTAML
jgi:hypothetical protein